MFIENDYPAALALARRQGLPLFVDAWAPWCHSCVSLKEFVLKDPALYPVVPNFVWASVDTEHPSSAAFVQQFPMEVWPTLWVIDPAHERPVLKWAGSATAGELVSLLRASVESEQDADTRAAWQAWHAGNDRIAASERDAGIREYERALELAPATFSGRPHLVEALVFQLRRAGSHEPCLALAAREFATLPKGTSRLNTVLSGLGCANALGTKAPEALRSALVSEADRMAHDDTEPVLADDRSSLFQELVYQWQTAGNDARARSTAVRWSAFLAREATKATSPSARVVFDYHRLLAYEAEGALERAIPMLNQSERDFPNDYNAPSRLAQVYLDLGQYELALAAIERAQARVYGPRTLRVLRQKADILTAMKQPDRARAVLQEAVAFGERAGHLPAGYQRMLEGLKGRLRGETTE